MLLYAKVAPGSNASGMSATLATVSAGVSATGDIEPRLFREVRDPGRVAEQVLDRDHIPSVGAGVHVVAHWVGRLQAPLRREHSTAMAVNCFVTEPRRNCVSGVFGMPFASSAMPMPSVNKRSPSRLTSADPSKSVPRTP